MSFSIKQNDAYHVGTDHNMDFTVTTDGTTAVNITGATPINWDIRVHPLSATSTLAKTGAVTTGASGIFRVTILAADGPAIGLYAMQVDMTLSSEETVVAEGSFEVKPKNTV